MSANPNNVSFLCFESHLFNNHLFSIEVKITLITSSTISYSLISQGCEKNNSVVLSHAINSPMPFPHAKNNVIYSKNLTRLYKLVPQLNHGVKQG